MIHLTVDSETTVPPQPLPATDATLPTSREVIAAMNGHLPTEHAAAAVLSAAFLLGSMDSWINPDAVATRTADTATILLWEIGIHDVTASVRTRLIDKINHFTRSCEIGPAIDAVARAWSEFHRAARHRGASNFDDMLYRRAVAALATARARYTRTRSDLAEAGDLAVAR